MDYGINEATAEWKTHADKDGFIKITPEEIVEGIEDFDERTHKEETLYSAMYFHETEWKDEKEEEWRFVDENI